MKKQIYLGLVLTAVFVFMGISPNQAKSSNNHEAGVVQHTSTASPASARWFFETVYSYLDTGQHVSLALDPVDDRPYISYYDGTEGDLKLAYVDSFNVWQIITIDQSVVRVSQAPQRELDDSFDLDAFNEKVRAENPKGARQR